MVDWEDFRYFLAVARLGNLSAAGKELRVSQPTVGRRLANLESDLGVRLLYRTSSGYVLTPAGQEVREGAERLEAEAQSLERTVSNWESQIAGTVRITCAEPIAIHILAPSFGDLCRTCDGLVIELMPEALTHGSPLREAELSVRFTTTPQPHLTSQHLGNWSYGLYASVDYLKLHGPVDFETGCAGHYLVSQFDDLENAPQFDWLSEQASSARIVFRTISHEAALSAAARGVGLACLACFRADREEGLVKIHTPVPVPSSSIWMTVHGDDQHKPRIKVVMEHISNIFHDLQKKTLAALAVVTTS